MSSVAKYLNPQCNGSPWISKSSYAFKKNLCRTDRQTSWRSQIINKNKNKKYKMTDDPLKCTERTAGPPVCALVIFVPPSARHYICLSGLQMKTNDSEYNWHVTLEARRGSWEQTDGWSHKDGCSSVVTTLMRMKTSFNFNFVLLDFLRHWCWNLDTWKASNHGGTGLFLHSHGPPELRSSIWWKDEEVIILWYFDLWWMGPEIERWLLL